MKNAKYWGERATKREESYQAGNRKTILQVQRSYNLAFENIEKQLKSLEDKIGKLDGKTEDFKRFSEKAESLKLLQKNIDLECKKLANIELKTTTDRYKNLVKEGFYKTIFDTQKGLGLGFNFTNLPTKAIEEALKTKWKGRNFSSSVWKNTTKLANRSKDIVTAGFMTGDSVQIITNNLKKEMNCGQFVAERLIRSETNFFANQGELLAYKESGVEHYEYLATLDNRTSELCSEQDGKVYKVEDAKVGENYPPLHAFCRSTTVARFDFENIADLKRRARNPETGENMLVPADISYKDWHKKRVLQNDDVDGIIKPLIDLIPKEDILEFNDRLSKMRDLERILIERNIKNLKFDNTNYLNNAFYSPMTKGITLNLSDEKNNPRGSFATLFHEMGHWVDNISNDISVSKKNMDRFKKAITNDAKNYVKKITEEITATNGIKASTNEVKFTIFNKLKGGQYSATSDLLGGSTNIKYGGNYGHSKEYWNLSPYLLNKEAFAHFFEANTGANYERKNVLFNTFPNAKLIYDEMIKEVVNIDK